MTEWIGKTIGKVRIDQFLARGGMAEVYLGTHLTLDRPVAVKVMHSYIEAEPDFLMRFQREARVVAGLRHPNIVQVYDFDTADGHPYIVMEYLKGPSLATYLRAISERNEKIPQRQVVRLLRSLSSALDYAHSQEIIHRDIKPWNILLHSEADEIPLDRPLAEDVDAVITDFGLVRIADSTHQTASGLVSGTPAYMSPEQALGEKVDHRTDIYSLGIVMYELLAGRVPFEGDSTMAVIYKHINAPIPPIEGIDSKVQAVMDKALAKDPNKRHQTALEMTLELERSLGFASDSDSNSNSVSDTIFAPRMGKSKPSLVSLNKEPQPDTTKNQGLKNDSPKQGVSKPQLPKAKRSRSPLLVGGLIFVCACLSIILLGGMGLSALSIFPWQTTKPTESSAGETPSGQAATVMPMPGEVQSLGVLRFQNGNSLMDHITISASLPIPSQGTQYEAWLINDTGEQRRSLGVLAQNEAGQFVITYVDPQARNMLNGFSRMEITVEPNPDDSPNPSTQVAYSSTIPAGALMHIRHLLVEIDETPNHVGMATGLVYTANEIKNSADAMLEAFTAGNTKKTKADAEAIINMIVGKQEPLHYKDWDGDGKINDPGDGYGLLLNGDQAGYIGGVIDHAQLAGQSADAPANILEHSGHVIICAKNVEDWATQLRDLAIRVASNGSDPVVEADVRSISALANQLLNGIDINGNETIDPIVGECGAFATYQHSFYMSDMNILLGRDQVPPPGK